MPKTDQGLKFCIYEYIPGTCVPSILGLEPSKRRSFPLKIRVIWVLGMYMLYDIYSLLCLYIYIYTFMSKDVYINSL